MGKQYVTGDGDTYAVTRIVYKKEQSSEQKAIYRSELSQLAEQLKLLGLWIKDIRGDGNCLFRAVSDQFFGHDKNHKSYRQKTIEYIAAHRDRFEPFVEDDETFDSYVHRMSYPGVWAGNMELQALSLVTGYNIVIHQVNAPRWEIVNHQEPDAKFIHLAYHSAQHYSSVRSLLDNGKGPALPIDRNLHPLSEEELEERFHLRVKNPTVVNSGGPSRPNVFRRIVNKFSRHHIVG
eukprot:GILJ01014013.1.p1 GENE.GILJ01014013.1~~GILJ01014013.1.p1  ORF type:complete len:235 (+),score=20.11 GILJ01014013.1:211-915(+)